MAYKEDVQALIKKSVGLDNVEVVGEGVPTICGKVSLEPFGQMGHYVLFRDQNGKMFATPAPCGLSEGPDYCSVTG